MTETGQPQRLSVDYRELLGAFASYTLAVSMEPERAVYQEGELVGYWQATEYLEELLSMIATVEQLMNAEAECAGEEGEEGEEAIAPSPDPQRQYRKLAAMHGDGGFWCQAEAQYLNAPNRAYAVDLYRGKVSRGEIGISSHLGLIAELRLCQILGDWRYRLIQQLCPDVPPLCTVEQARKRLQGIEDIELLRFALLVAIDAHTCVQEWLGHASTQDAARDSMWRFHRVLGGLGINVAQSSLDWRGSLVEALERAGFRASQDGDIRRILPGQPGHEYAKGETLAEFVSRHEGWNNPDA